jgi:hypothetical protein
MWGHKGPEGNGRGLSSETVLTMRGGVECGWRQPVQCWTQCHSVTPVSHPLSHTLSHTPVITPVTSMNVPLTMSRWSRLRMASPRLKQLVDVTVSTRGAFCLSHLLSARCSWIWSACAQQKMMICRAQHGTACDSTEERGMVKYGMVLKIRPRVLSKEGGEMAHRVMQCPTTCQGPAAAHPLLMQRCVVGAEQLPDERAD